MNRLTCYLRKGIFYFFSIAGVILSLPTQSSSEKSTNEIHDTMIFVENRLIHDGNSSRSSLALIDGVVLFSGEMNKVLNPFNQKIMLLPRKGRYSINDGQVTIDGEFYHFPTRGANPEEYEVVPKKTWRLKGYDILNNDGSITYDEPEEIMPPPKLPLSFVNTIFIGEISFMGESEYGVYEDIRSFAEKPNLYFVAVYEDRLYELKDNYNKELLRHKQFIQKYSEEEQRDVIPISAKIKSSLNKNLHKGAESFFSFIGDVFDGFVKVVSDVDFNKAISVAAGVTLANKSDLNVQQRQEFLESYVKDVISGDTRNLRALQNKYKDTQKVTESTSIAINMNDAYDLNKHDQSLNSSTNIVSKRVSSKDSPKENECIAKTESGSLLPKVAKGYCNYVLSDYTRTAEYSFQEDGFRWGLDSTSVEDSAISLLRSKLLFKAQKTCKAEGYTTVFHDDTFNVNDVTPTVRECKSSKVMTGMEYACRGTTSFFCGKYNSSN